MPAPHSGLHRLEIENFRNIQHARLVFSEDLNLITGPNAAGKTSLLEAIHCLGRVRSFRTSDPDYLIRYTATCYRLVGQIGIPGRRTVPVGIERQPGKYTIHLDGEPVQRLSDLAGRFPVQILSGDTQNIIHGGPRFRRQTMDWALFHVEQGYRTAWQRYLKSLRQRNACLRSQAPANQVKAWDTELVDAAEVIDRMRRNYLEALEPCVKGELADLLPDSGLTIRYLAGWPKNVSLAKALENALKKDQSVGYTHYGPHRADFALHLDGRSVLSHCSRGQQRTIMAGFLIGQLELQQAQEVPMGAFLLDDLSSELDQDHQERILAELIKLPVQVFVTAITAGSLHQEIYSTGKRFHVEHGEIQEMI